ncbi:MAG: hypothetical protein E5X23_18960 [Mesorhizobium sp.]|nr:hypothetical protein EOA91_17040 [Mesorhizobium sp. M1A.F.Ca.IN.022.04.1.1]RWG34872.1 MAG: hypothetical protein EOQ60_08270 [Mesorhizobium sp.]RWG50867.1 MAG: hypothetical protein EOQ63_08630 [Mesorhizobium sp.]RWG63600.1 MAG: hypothetical protein EOQ65_02095 [Mesorhizobium sp.]RWH20541.1 MAG: hypothetical protein EOQ75_16095 [Mesorhizobium sp.]
MRGSAIADGATVKWIVAGWLLFIVSALFFIAAAWRAGDLLALGGGIFFLVACFRSSFRSRPESRNDCGWQGPSYSLRSLRNGVCSSRYSPIRSTSRLSRRR